MTTVDASWAAASRGDGTFDPWYMVGVSIPQYAGWVLGTVVGVFIGPRLGDPNALGLDALFPAFFIALLFEEARGRPRLAAAGGGAGIALVLTPLVPAGLPILAAAAAAVAARGCARDRGVGRDRRARPRHRGAEAGRAAGARRHGRCVRLR